MPIKVITDTICDVPKEFVDRYDIKVMPLTVHFGEETYRDGIDITMEEFYKKLEVCENLPTTSQVTPIEFYGAFKTEVDSGNEVIAILGSSKVSGTYNAAVLAQNQLEVNNIYVVDSQGVALGAGMLVIKAARLAEQGLSADEIVKEIEASKTRMRHIFILDTLKYLHKGGRISLSASILGSLLNIKPIITVVDGKLEMMDKARGIKKALSVVFDLIKQSGWSLDHKVIGINHTAAPEQAAMLMESIKNEYDIKEFIQGEVGSVVATHAGPGAIAFYFEE